MYIAILGRQPTLGMAELECVYGAPNVGWFSDISAQILHDTFLLDRLGGTQKAGKVVVETQGDWRRVSMKIVQEYTKKWIDKNEKITLGISAYGFDEPARDVQKTGIILKQRLKSHGVSLRLIPNNEPSLNTATSHHNKLGLSENKIELLVVRTQNGKVIVAESIGAQNITAYTKRDQERPKRDAFVGMLPPKLAQIIINLAIGPVDPRNDHFTILDPFCGTGVILQEALRMGCLVSGTDLDQRMVNYTLQNLEWFKNISHTGTILTVEQGDATTHEWLEASQVVDAVATETYLGQPFSAPPSREKLASVQKNCDHIISSFLKNISQQLKPKTPLCIAIPAWRDSSGNFTHLKLTSQLPQLGFIQRKFTHVTPSDLIYYRDSQVVARELLVLTKA